MVHLWYCYCYCELHAPAVVLDPKCSTREPVNYGEQSSPIGVDAADKEVVGKDEVGVITCIYIIRELLVHRSPLLLCRASLYSSIRNTDSVAKTIDHAPGV